MNFIKGFILGLYIVTTFKYLDVNNLIYLIMLCGTPFLGIALFWKQI